MCRGWINTYERAEIMKQSHVMMTALTVVLAVSLTLVAGAEAAHGPIWVSPSFNGSNCIKLPGGLWTFESEATCKSGTPKITTGSWERMLGSGEKEGITFANKGATKLEVPSAGLTVSCESAKTGSALTDIVGGSPGTSAVTIKQEKCKAGACEANSPGAEKGTVEFKANEELAYETKAAAEKEEGPLLVLFRTTESGKKEFVKIEFAGECLPTSTVLANGTNKTVVEEGAPGQTGSGCVPVMPTPPVEKANEVICEEVAVKKYFWWKAGVVTEGNVGLELSTFKFEAKQVGNYVTELKSGEPWAAAG
jgi:hypothetical protein